MDDSITILNTMRDDDDGILVYFSDGTVAGFVVEELLELRPHRESGSPLKNGEMTRQTVFFNCLPQPDGSTRYSVRIDPYKITEGYAEEQFWRLMVQCFAADDSSRVSFLAELSVGETIVRKYSLSPKCWSRIERAD